MPAGGRSQCTGKMWRSAGCQVGLRLPEAQLTGRRRPPQSQSLQSWMRCRRVSGNVARRRVGSIPVVGLPRRGWNSSAGVAPASWQRSQPVVSSRRCHPPVAPARWSAAYLPGATSAYSTVQPLDPSFSPASTGLGVSALTATPNCRAAGEVSAVGKARAEGRCAFLMRPGIGA